MSEGELSSTQKKHHHSHRHGNRNQHKTKSKLLGRKLLKATLLNFFITVLQVVGGLFSNSVSLLSDALHNFSDAIAILISYLANKASIQKPDEINTFGKKRVEIIAALFNGLVLAFICVFLIFEAYKRFVNPQLVDSKVVIVIASIGLLANLYAVVLLKNDSKHNLNVKSAYLHLLGDTFSSFAVVIGGVVMYYTNFYWIDPLVTFLISLYILKESFEVIKEAYYIISQATPKSIEIEKIKTRLEMLPEINNIHHVHVWNLNDSDIHFESHVDLANDIRISETEGVNSILKTILQKEFGIVHTTIQYEYNCCSDKSIIREEI